MTARAPKGLGPRGRALWRELQRDVVLEPAAAVLVQEACRLADRLEKLDALLRGDVDTWVRVKLPDVTDEDFDLVLKVDGALSEARQQQNALRQIIASLGLARVAGEEDKGGDALDQLAAARASRLAAAASGQ